MSSFFAIIKLQINAGSNMLCKWPLGLKMLIELTLIRSH